ncbi:MAG: CPBP family intramembrane metalloprotease, partial [Bacteroidetes bacterium]|nr:CPBP family intramembrane metalloprotease [Bacteroidota bacterium]
MDWSTYHRVTRTATYGFLSALPLLVLYEVMIIAVNESRIGQVRVGAEVWLKSLLALVGGTGFIVLGLVLIVVGSVIFIYERNEHIPIRARYLAW